MLRRRMLIMLGTTLAVVLVLGSYKGYSIYQQLQKLMLDEMPQITVDHLPLFFLGNKGVDGLIIGPSGIDDLSNVSLTEG